MITPWWPLAALAFVQFGDGLMCLRPPSFIRQCLVDVHFPRRFWWVLPPIKFAAAAGLVIGIWVPPLAILTSVALVLYFLIAAAAHIRAHDFGRNLFLNCTATLLSCVAVLIFTITAA
ncbi:DoxX family protein [Pseudonocardia spinosispora]|uniref:DoxX family protein n=1 Tax=Pseudonocardia spinosispora TaxID=103441 RepID=UPI0004206ADF|nr:DoxX family protein [Pseudonocardia spinosispora]